MVSGKVQREEVGVSGWEEDMWEDTWEEVVEVEVDWGDVLRLPSK